MLSLQLERGQHLVGRRAGVVELAAPSRADLGRWGARERASLRARHRERNAAERAPWRERRAEQRELRARRRPAALHGRRGALGVEPGLGLTQIASGLGARGHRRLPRLAPLIRARIAPLARGGRGGLQRVATRGQQRLRIAGEQRPVGLAPTDPEQLREALVVDLGLVREQRRALGRGLLLRHEARVLPLLGALLVRDQIEHRAHEQMPIVHGEHRALRLAAAVAPREEAREPRLLIAREPRQHVLPADRRVLPRESRHRQRRHRHRLDGREEHFVLEPLAPREHAVERRAAHRERVRPDPEGPRHRPELARDDHFSNDPGRGELGADAVSPGLRRERRLAEDVADHPTKRGLSGRVPAEPTLEQPIVDAGLGGRRPENVEPPTEIDPPHHVLVPRPQLAQDPQSPDPERRLRTIFARFRRALRRSEQQAELDTHVLGILP